MIEKIKCESCDKLKPIEEMHTDKDANWFCEKCINESNNL